MSEQLNKILEISADIKSNFPLKFKPLTALISDEGFDIFSGFKILKELNFDKFFPGRNPAGKTGKILFAKCGSKDVIIYRGRFHYYNGVHMRDIGDTIYVLRYLGIKNIISIDEAGHLNPRFNCGEIALIYDHINLTGDNPLIGKNDNRLGLRFPDMSNAYDRDSYRKIYKILQEKKIKINEAVYLGIAGPQTETEAEARFYRDTGADVLGYSIVPENITSVHAGMRFSSVALITRCLVADKMMEDERSENQMNRDQKEYLKTSAKELSRVIKDIIVNI